jgi:hypothetical protein
MKFKKIKLCVILMLAIGLAELKAQEAIPATGGNASGAGGSVAYTVGQVAYSTNLTSSGSESQGVQQPYEISVVSGLADDHEFSLNCSVYPNPASDFLLLSVAGEIQTSYIASLSDMNGKIITNIIVSNTETKIDLRGLVPAVYFLKISGSKQNSLSKQMNNQTSVIQIIKTFKIIKK